MFISLTCVSGGLGFWISQHLKINFQENKDESTYLQKKKEKVAIKYASIEKYRKESR